MKSPLWMVIFIDFPDFPDVRVTGDEGWDGDARSRLRLADLQERRLRIRWIDGADGVNWWWWWCGCGCGCGGGCCCCSSCSSSAHDGSGGLKDHHSIMRWWAISMRVKVLVALVVTVTMCVREIRVQLWPWNKGHLNMHKGKRSSLHVKRHHFHQMGSFQNLDPPESHSLLYFTIYPLVI